MAIRYVLIVSGIFITFNDFFTCVMEQLPLSDYFLFVGIPLILVCLLVFVPSNTVVCFTLSFMGVLTIIDNGSDDLSYGILFLIYAKRMARNVPFSICIYFITVLAIIANRTMENERPSDAINIIIAAAVVYVLDHVLPGGPKK